MNNQFLSQSHLQQKAVIAEMERQVISNALNFSTVDPVDNFDTDPRTCLTSVCFITGSILNQIHQFIDALKIIEPHHYYYADQSLHCTIKNIRGIAYPENFNQEDIAKTVQVFDQVVPKYPPMQLNFYRLMLFNNNLALIGLTDPNFSKLVVELDDQLKLAGTPDDKTYISNQAFFLFS